jgi:hypothetical protein
MATIIANNHSEAVSRQAGADRHSSFSVAGKQVGEDDGPVRLVFPI